MAIDPQWVGCTIL